MSRIMLRRCHTGAEHLPGGTGGSSLLALEHEEIESWQRVLNEERMLQATSSRPGEFRSAGGDPKHIMGLESEYVAYNR